MLELIGKDILNDQFTLSLRYIQLSPNQLENYTP